MKSTSLTLLGGLTQLIALLTFCVLAKLSDGPLKLIGWVVFAGGTCLVLKRVAAFDTKHAMLQLAGLSLCVPISMTLAGLWFRGLIKDVRVFSLEHLWASVLLALGAFFAYGVAWAVLRLLFRPTTPTGLGR